jgi:hypothetical protein
MKTTTRILTAGALAAFVGTAAWAKLPPPTPEAKAKAAEAAAKADWTNKVGAYQLCRAMDRVAQRYLAAAKADPAASAPTPVSTPPCADPGPFVYTPKEAEPPLEAAGAHSPAKTATAPPNSKTPDAEQSPKK